jgi:hypothetical protein
MTRKKQVNWTAEEMKTIYNMKMHGSSISDISDVFPKRTLDSLKTKITRMGFSIVDRGAK